MFPFGERSESKASVCIAKHVLLPRGVGALGSLKKTKEKKEGQRLLLTLPFFFLPIELTYPYVKT